MKHLLTVLQIIVIATLFYAISLTFKLPTQVSAQACTTPAAVTNVVVTYPDCTGSTCLFTQANCTWAAVTGAASYQITATEVDSNTVVKNQTVDSATTKVVFPVTSGKTYKCDVTAINSCGQSGGTGSDTLLCKIDGITSAPTAVPTSAPLVKNTPIPTLAPTGDTQSMIIVGSIIAVFSIIGISLLIL